MRLPLRPIKPAGCAAERVGGAATHDNFCRPAELRGTHFRGGVSKT
ncbi:hypothetical protein [Primorskyibacter sp. S187A]